MDPFSCLNSKTNFSLSCQCWMLQAVYFQLAPSWTWGTRHGGVETDLGTRQIQGYVTNSFHKLLWQRAKALLALWEGREWGPARPLPEHLRLSWAGSGQLEDTVQRWTLLGQTSPLNGGKCQHSIFRWKYDLSSLSWFHETLIFKKFHEKIFLWFKKFENFIYKQCELMVYWHITKPLAYSKDTVKLV